MTYGGDTVSRSMVTLAKTRAHTVAFFLHNFGYRKPDSFANVDCAVVPSEFAQAFYRKTIGLECRVLPLVVDPARGVAAGREPRYVTFVNPEPWKGPTSLARIAEVLARCRPDIRLLLVEGIRGQGLVALAADRPGRNRQFDDHAPAPDPWAFLAVTKLLLMPSLMENAALVAMEAMLNGIPVLGSTRAAACPRRLATPAISLTFRTVAPSKRRRCRPLRRSNRGSAPSSGFGTMRTQVPSQQRSGAGAFAAMAARAVRPDLSRLLQHACRTCRVHSGRGRRR